MQSTNQNSVNPTNPTKEEEEYIKQMDEKEREAYEIAKKHLGSSFNLRRSIGFKKFITQKK